MMQADIFIQEISLRAIAEKFNTPCYVYDSEQLRLNYEALKHALSSQVDVFYSLKANPSLAVSAELRACGAGAEVCSGVELELALAAGFARENIIFVGPAKKKKEIERLLDEHILIACESISEFETISLLAEKKKTIARVVLRINPQFSVRQASLKMGGVASQFGMDEEWVRQHKDLFLHRNFVRIEGLHVYSATRILDAEIVAENIKHILTLTKEISKEWNCSFSVVDVGGGIGVPYFKEEKEFDLKKFHELVTPVLIDFQNTFPQIRIILESGRFLTATAGQFVCQIVDIKKSRHEKFVITDGGMNCHLTAAGYGSVMKRNFPISALTRQNSNKKETYHIAGPLCTPADVIGRNVELPGLQVGDLIVIHTSGAYGPTASPVLFLSHGHPAEILVKGKNSHLIRAHDSAQDFMRHQKICS